MIAGEVGDAVPCVAALPLRRNMTSAPIDVAQGDLRYAGRCAAHEGGAEGTGPARPMRVRCARTTVAVATTQGRHIDLE